jgi:cell division protein FtsZ
MLEFEISGSSVTSDFPTTKLAVMGVGGGGNNTINALIEAGKCDYTCIAVNTDAQALEMSRAPQRVRIGTNTTRGRGAGADPLLGKAAAEEDIHHVVTSVKDADLVFLIGGLGGGTGSGALPVIAQALKEHNILTICLATKPFAFEGKRRMLIADQTIELLKGSVDTLITIPNEKLFEFNQQSALSFVEACGMINGIINDYVRAITDIITKPGLINVDFADVRTVIKGQGPALMGTARAEGPDRALEAAHSALTSPFAESTTIQKARNILINITADHTLSLQEVQQAASRIAEDCDEHATIIIGSVIDESMGDALGITVIATGLIQQPASAQDLRTQESRYLYVNSRPTYHDTKPAPQPTPSVPQVPPATLVQSAVNTTKESSISLSKEHHLREMIPSLEKRLKEQHHLSLEELETPAFLRKLSKESSNTN